MRRTIYHGSTNIIQEPKLFEGGIINDFGPGFYCAEDEELSFEWASTEISDGYVNSYVLNMDGLEVLDLDDVKCPVLTWLTIVLKNRVGMLTDPVAINAREYLFENFLSIKAAHGKLPFDDYSDYDVILGYRADDSYYSLVRSFMNNKITVKQLAKALELGKSSRQVVLKSEKAFEHLYFQGYETVYSPIYFARRKTRDEKLRRDINKMLEKSQKDTEEKTRNSSESKELSGRKRVSRNHEIYMKDIIGEEMSKYDPRLR